MRLLIVSDLYEPTINGVATFSKNLAMHMARRGHDVVVIAPSQTSKPYTEFDDGFRVERIRSIKFAPYQNMYVSAGMYRPVAAVFDEFKPEIVHIQTPLGLGWDATAAARRRNIRVISTNHTMPENFIENIRGMKLFSKSMDYAIRQYGKAFFGGADIVTFPTKLAIKMLKPKNFKLPTLALSNGIDLSYFKPAPAKPLSLMQKYNIPTDKKIIIYVGRIDPEKRISVILKGFKQLLDSGKNYHLAIVGSGLDLENLKNIAQELDFKNEVTFTGRVSDEELRQFYHAGDVYAIASTAELQCIAALEAMSSGLPIVAVNAGALPSLCRNGVNGYRFNVNDSTGLAKGIEKVLSADAETYKKMSQASRAEAEKHDIQTAMDEFEKLYERVLKLPKRRRSLARRVFRVED